MSDSGSFHTKYLETTSVHFEWTIQGIGGLLDASGGSSKSEVIKSIMFGLGRWQILFNPNSGVRTSQGSFYMGMYLSCEPTAEEHENGVNGQWARQGLFEFKFELRSLNRRFVYGRKETHNQSFSSQQQIWGWPDFRVRDQISRFCKLKGEDGVVVICDIYSAPFTLVDPPLTLHRPIPNDLLDAMGGLLDDPLCSDVEFVLPRRRKDLSGAKRIYAAQRLLERMGYFNAMLQSGFAEGSTTYSLSGNEHRHSPDSDSVTSNRTHEDSSPVLHHFEDSDEEEEENDTVSNADIDTVRDRMEATFAGTVQDKNLKRGDMHVSDVTMSGVAETGRRPSPLAGVVAPNKLRIIVRDVAYATYRAVLYYVYTNTIVFAPLSSSFLIASTTTPQPTESTSVAPGTENKANLAYNQRIGDRLTGASGEPANSPRSRREWIAQWEKQNRFGKPRPCSAKAVYRLADRYDLQELKQRAFQHIIKSLTVENIAYEMFSAFTATYEDVRKVQVSFFLDNWSEIRGSDSMRTVLQQIRQGRHPGFEEVWRVIALNLEVEARPVEAHSHGTAGEC